MEEPDYLSEEEEEINEYEMPPPDQEQRLDAVNLSAASTNGITFSGEEEFETALNNIKELAHEEFFQNDDREKVHNMNVLNEYIKFLALINEAIIFVFQNKQPIDNMFSGEIGEKLKEGLKHFFNIILAQSQLPLNGQQAAYRNKLVKLHLIDYPYCHRKECLTMD